MRCVIRTRISRSPTGEKLLLFFSSLGLFVFLAETRTKHDTARALRTEHRIQALQGETGDRLLYEYYYI